MGDVVTIRDVARLAQVSVATVSRALNGRENVASGVRARVIDAAKELRYVPHHAARSLSSRRTRTIGVVLPDLHGEFFSELMRGIDQVAREHDLYLLVSSYHGHPEEQGVALRAMRGRVDGLLVMSPFVESTPLADDFDDAHPVVLINTGLTGIGLGTLRVDNHGGARGMVQHLAARGFRRIAFVAGPEGNFDAAERLRGYREALAEFLPDADPIVLPGAFDESSGHRAGQAIIAMAERPDAVFCANDMTALGCLFAFHQAGLRVPDDIALAGFDDIPLARYVHPSLTTIAVDIAELGGLALRALIAGTPLDSAPIAPHLVVRESTQRDTPPAPHGERRDSS
ncbi:MULTISPECIES: LacI family DNA-binding transcriptional regulator [Lysobacteraceae]|uniref:LacI family DNA-binding transcriptional regulator n=1 Tax=Lysobacteraceae TaxID=32033 RepID=UPI001BD1A78E|nr:MULTISPECIES: LacI family DNA-binding transcriptional regulator [Lysobacter]